MFPLNVLHRDLQCPQWCNAWVCHSPFCGWRFCFCTTCIRIWCSPLFFLFFLRMFDHRWPLFRRCAVQCRVPNKSPLWKLNIVVCRCVTSQKWIRSLSFHATFWPAVGFAASSRCTGTSPARTGGTEWIRPRLQHAQPVPWTLAAV